MRTYGYNDKHLVPKVPLWNTKRWLALILALTMITCFWLALDQKLLFGEDWISQTYDHEDWRTNEGNLHTFGAWDLEAHIWKTEQVIENWPNFHWNPYWYLGMPLLKYYQLGFYFIHWGFMILTGTSAARASVLMLIFSHLLATFLTFLLCYKVSRRIWASALCSVFLLSNTFISLRSYGWEPITVVFLFLYPLGLLLFLKEPMRPFRFWLVLVVGLAYLSHPLIWFSLLMMMGLYIFSLSIRRNNRNDRTTTIQALRQYVLVTFTSILIGAVQFIPQFTYKQVSSGAHMGVTYLPFYQVPFNIITLKDFFFDAGNLKGPGPIIMIALFFLIIFAIIDYRHRLRPKGQMLHNHEMIMGLTFALSMMVLFYYLELWNLFPMNLLRSIQYHRIIPEFIVTAAVLVAALSNITYTFSRKLIYYTMLIAFVVVSSIIIFNVQSHWMTTNDISDRPEFIHEAIEGRISFPYTDQSLSVRNSFTKLPQVYGYYEQGITNSYNDEIFSVSSGFHNADLTVLYLKAVNVGRLYVNMEEGKRDEIVRARMNKTLDFIDTGERYSYFIIPLKDASFAQAVSFARTRDVEQLEMGCREMFKEKYCGSVGEEFVGTDNAENTYLRAYVELLEEEYIARADLMLINPDQYDITVKNADLNTAVIVKMTYDRDFTADINGKDVPISKFGPDFMLLYPLQEGDYNITLRYHINKGIKIGGIISIVAIIALILFFTLHPRIRKPTRLSFSEGEM